MLKTYLLLWRIIIHSKPNEEWLGEKLRELGIFDDNL